MSETLTGWRLHRLTNLTWEQLAGWIGPVIAAGWLRRGEAAGLCWHDIDLDSKVTYVTWQVQPDDRGALAVCPLKTPASRRVVALDATTIAVLKAHRAAQQWACQANRVQPSGYVFTRADGGTGVPGLPDPHVPATGRGQRAPAGTAAWTCGTAPRRWRWRRGRT